MDNLKIFYNYKTSHQINTIVVSSYPALCNPMDCSPPGSSVHRISQARILEWVTKPSSRGSFWPRDQTHISCVSCTGKVDSLPLCHRWSPINTMCCVLSQVQLFSTPRTVAHQAPLSMGILQARILEWVAKPFSRGSFWSRDRTQVFHIADRFFTIWTPGKVNKYYNLY